MDPYGIENIVLPDLLCNTIFGALKCIDTISPKTYELLGNLVFWQITTYYQSLHKPPLLNYHCLTPLSKEM
jgi:hypothetical protein